MVRIPFSLERWKARGDQGKDFVCDTMRIMAIVVVCFTDGDRWLLELDKKS